MGIRPPHERVVVLNRPMFTCDGLRAQRRCNHFSFRSSTGSDTVSKDGTIGHRTLTGTFTVNANCSGSAKLQFSDGSATSMDLVLGNGGQAINFIDTDNNVIVTGTATAQYAFCGTGRLSRVTRGLK